MRTAAKLLRGLVLCTILCGAAWSAPAAGEPDASRLRHFDAWLEKSDFQHAQRALDELARDFPDHPAVQLRQARMDRYSGRLDRAARTLSQLFQNDDTFNDARRELAEVAFLRHDFGRAWTLFMEPYENQNPPGEVLIWAGLIDYLTQNSYGVSMVSASLEVADAYRPYASAFALLAAFNEKADARARAMLPDFPALPEHPLKSQLDQFSGRVKGFYAARQPTKWAETGHPQPVFEVSWISPAGAPGVAAIAYRAHRIADPTAVREAWVALLDRRTDAYARVSVHNYPDVSVVIHNTEYRHYGINLHASGKRLHNPIDVVFSLQPDGTLGLVIDGEPLLGRGTREVYWSGISEARASLAVTSPSQDYPLETLWSEVALTDGAGVAAPAVVKRALPALHAYRHSDDLREVDLKLVLFVPRGNRVPDHWRQKLEYAAGQFQKLHFRMFEGRSLLVTEIAPEPVVGDFNHHCYSNLRYGDLNDQVKREVCAKTGYSLGPGYPALLVFADVRLEPYDPVANYGSGGLSWLHKGFSLVTREILERAPDRPEVGADEQTPWMGKPDRLVHASWPWAVSYHEFLHGLGCPHTFVEPDSIMGAGLFAGTAKANLPPSVLRYMRGLDVPDEQVLAQARRMMQEKDYAAALECYQQALRASPGDLALQYEQAQCLSQAGRHDQALLRAQELCAAQPASEIYLWFLGSQYYQLGRMEEARNTFNELLKKNPRNAFAHNYLSYIYTYSQRHKDRQQALRHAEEALRLFETEDGKADARKHLATIKDPNGPFKDGTS